MGKQTTDFRYNTGATKVPWAAVGENYNVQDLMEIIRFLMQGEGKEYDDALEAVWQQVKKLDELATPPGKLSLGSKVEEAEKRAADAERIAEAQTAAREAESAVAKKKTELEAEDEELVERAHSGDSIDSFNAGLDLLRQQSERGNKRNSRAGSSRT